MSKIWTPNGNKYQTEIDVHIAAIDKQYMRLSADAGILRSDLIILEQDLAEVTETLNTLKSDVRIISLREFTLVKTAYRTYLKARDNCLATLRKIEEEIERTKKKKEKLLNERDLCRTKIVDSYSYIESNKDLKDRERILEFYSHVRSKKRQKNRD